MSFHTKKQFADLCGKEQKYIQTYLTRKKLRARPDGYMDDQDPLNAAFLRKMRLKMKESPNVTITSIEKKEERPESKSVNSKKKEKPISKEVDPAHYHSKLPLIKEAENYSGYNTEPDDDDIEKFSLDRKKKALDIKLLEEKIEIERLKKEKLEGDVIPTDIVKSIFSSTFKAVTNRFYQTAESISQIMIDQLGGSREDMIEFRSKLIAGINESVKDSQNEAKKMIVNIVEEYSQKRGVGEKK